MDTTLDLDEEHYKPCKDDPEWARCEFCWKKVYAGKNQADLWRHKEQCEWR